MQKQPASFDTLIFSIQHQQSPEYSIQVG